MDDLSQTDDLSQPVWLGGSACAGKTTLARLLAARHGLALYSTDEAFEAHRRRADERRHPDFRRLMDLPPKRLFAPPAEVQAADLLGFYRDEFEMVLEDLRALSAPLLVEGVGLLPGLVATAAPDPRRALWLIATPGFRRSTYPPRGGFVRDLLASCPDPQAAFDRWMERDDLVARHLEEEARRLGRQVLTVDGERGIEEMAAAVAERLGL
jgi:hypothetical protein